MTRENMIGLLAVHREVLDALKASKPVFEEFITDQSITLAERWEFWKAAPVAIKNTGGWISAGRLESFKLLGMSDAPVGYDGPVYVERGANVELANDIVANLRQILFDDYLEEVHDHFEDGDNALLDDDEAVDAFISIVKEEILKKNLHSYRYDW